VPRLTVLTPTWNRAATLPRLHDTLLRQTFRDFEWLVVDDGSEDETRELVAGWAADDPFPVRYAHQPNQGKHVALNHGAREARGEFCAVIDSDDWYVDEGLERLVRRWGEIPDPAAFCEVQGLSVDQEGRILGDRFPADVFDSDAWEMHYRHRVGGDKHGMIRTDVMREYPFPEDLGSPIVSPSLVWLRMSRRYRTRYVNDVIAAKEYLPGGLTDSKPRRAVEISGALLLLQREALEDGRPMPADVRYRTYANVIRNGLHQGVPLHRQFRDARSRAWWMAALPAGVALRSRDRRAAAGGRSSVEAG
jgi:glycosyltransferase involved in cell wall biosynthesis